MRTVTVYLSVKLVITADEDVEIEEVINELDYQFTASDGATVDHEEIFDFYVSGLGQEDE